ncbi:MAG: hypothetical protein QW261_03200 [Candidatus Jordarchaeaceae archaeon]
MGLKNPDRKGKPVEKEQSTYKSISNSSKLSSEQLKIINQFSHLRESIINSVKNKLPMKGIDAIIRQAFDEAVIRNMEEIQKSFSTSLPDKFLKTQAEDSPKEKFRNYESSEELQDHQHGIDVEREGNLEKTKTSDRINAFPEPKSVASDLKEDFQKRIDQLILEIKTRDKELKEREEEIKTLKCRLEILEQQNMPPFLENWTMREEYGEEDIKYLHNQIRLWEILWQKLKAFLGEDPKFKTLFILQRLGSISVENLSKALNLDSSQTETILQELKEYKFITLDKDIVRINSEN